jgi:hypothetical protein
MRRDVIEEASVLVVDDDGRCPRYIAGQSIYVLVSEVRPHHSLPGIVWLAVTAVAMFALAAGSSWIRWIYREVNSSCQCSAMAVAAARFGSATRGC